MRHCSYSFKPRAQSSITCRSRSAQWKPRCRFHQWLAKIRVEQLPNFNAVDVAQLDRTYSTAGHLACELARVNEFVEDAKASGSVQKAIDRAGPRGVTVAPPGNPAAQ